MKFAAVGEMVIDFLPGETEEVYLRKAGGAPANVSVAVARNGVKAGFCGIVGNDDFGYFLTKTLSDNKVTYLTNRYEDNAITTMAFVSLDKNGERSFTFARKPGADMFLSDKDIDAAKPYDADIVHAGSCSLSANPASDATIYAMKKAKDNGKIVSFDVNYRNLMWHDDRVACIKKVSEVLPLVDLLKISDEEEDMLGISLLDAAKKYDIAVIVETLGSHGAKCIFKGKEIKVEGKKVNCVDATGAGDAFWGGFISYLLKKDVKKISDITEDDIINALEYGNIAGSICVQKKGAIESLPTFEEIERLLANE